MQENTAPAASTDIALLPPSQRAVIVLESSKTEAQLRELVALSADIVEVKDKAGREQAHRAGMTLKTARVGIEKIGKEARADARAFADAVVAEEKRLIAISQPEEARILGLRDGYDAAEAAKKAELERIERERVQGIQAKIECIRNLPHASINDSAAELAATIADLEQLVPGIADFAEFCPDAATARDTAVAALKTLHDSAVAREAEATRLAAERAELEKLRAEAAERDRLAAEERRQQEQALAAEREALEAQRREQDARAAALEADRAAIARHQEEAKAEAARADAAPAPANDDAVEQVGLDLAAATAEEGAAVADVDNSYVMFLHPVATSVEMLRAALRDALLTLGTAEIRAIVEDELTAAEAA